jgi:hypothetical protein
VTASPSPTTDRFAVARTVADAVLYEGYVLYPYRASARKNQLRWQFGVLVPPAHEAAEGSERSSSRTEVVIDPGADATLHVRVRCLQVQHRAVEAVADGADGFVPAEVVEVNGELRVPWDEAVEHEIDLAPIRLLPLDQAGAEHPFELAGGEEVEVVCSATGTVVGRLVRRREAVQGRVCVVTAWADGVGARLKVAVRVENRTAWSEPEGDRDAVIQRSLVAVHTLLAVDDGTFVSLLDPPDDAAEAAAGCANEGTFPVLIGEEGDAEVMLSSPIILYDHPAVAPESEGDFCDATEIDEILALRVLTLTDEEKAEARGTDPRAAAIIDRCDDMPPEVWARLHGAIRSLRPAADPPAADEEQLPWWDPGVDAEVDPWADTTWIGGAEVGKGRRVRLEPSRRADAHDLFLAGRTGTVAGVFRDVDGAEHIAVTLDDDPASELYAWQGRFYYFHPDEVVVVDADGTGR